MTPDLSRLNPKPMDGTEVFTSADTAQPFTVQDFWRWSASDLMSNATRGILAEFIVAQALGIDTKTTVRQEWDAYDLKTPDGIKVEVKSSAYLQTWDQTDYSVITFGCAPTWGWDAETNTNLEKFERHSDVYVFCHLKTKQKHAAPGKQAVDPLKLEQWEFYVVSTKALNAKSLTQEQIALEPIKKLSGGAVNYKDLKEEVKKAAAQT